MRYLVAIALAVMLALPVTAQDFHKGWAAYKRGGPATALRERRSLAERRHAETQYNLGFIYANGEKGVSRGYAAALPVVAQDFNRGLEAYNRKNYAAALEEWLPLAENGHARAQHEVGRMYFLGYGVSQNAVKAYMWVYLAGTLEAKWKLHLATIASPMTPAQIAEAQRLAREWMEKHGK